MEIALIIFGLILLWLIRKTLYVWLNLAETASDAKAEDVKVAIANNQLDTVEKKIDLGSRIKHLAVDSDLLELAENFMKTGKPTPIPATVTASRGEQ